MDDWQRAFRASLPRLPRTGLLALREALQGDTEELAQGYTVEPPGLPATANWPIVSACAWVYAGWKGGKCATAWQGEVFFGEICADVDEALKESSGCRHFLQLFDGTP